jgi:hypothetical protein
MGCNCSRDESKVVVNKQILEKNLYLIKINIPETDRIKVIKHEGEHEIILLSDLMNSSFFLSRLAEELDANFISKYNPKTEEFEYYIQRIMGYELENEEEPKRGKMWVVYINGSKCDWSFLCAKNRIVRREDEIELKYEIWEEKEKNNKDNQGRSFKHDNASNKN